MSSEVTEREGLEIRIRATLEWEFGQACDFVKTLKTSGVIDEKTSVDIMRRIRSAGNRSISVVTNHLEFFNISRRPQAESINKERVARKAKARWQ